METRTRVLIAEDESIIRLDLRSLLEARGFDVCAEARDGQEAVELARSERPDLAIMDVKMPRLDGIEAARRILEERPIPIVMLTAYGQDELVTRAVDVGVFGYLVKPFREQDLLPAIRTALARHAERTPPEPPRTPLRFDVSLRSTAGPSWPLRIERDPGGTVNVSLNDPRMG
jgi:CheY-like chemotaxis protein